MTRERPTHARQFAANSATAARQVVRLGTWNVPVTVVAVSLSVILHAGLFAASYFVTWSSSPASKPEVIFAQGDQATRIQVLLVPWPAPPEEETKHEPQQNTSAAQLPDAAANAEETVVKPLPTDVAPETRPDPPVTVSDDPNPPAENDPVATEAAEVEILEKASETPPTNDAVEAALRRQSVEEILEYVRDRLKRFLAPPATSAQPDRQQPITTAAIEKSATPPTKETVQSKASSAQIIGVETGIETLDLPAPSYPSLSRKRGEEGLVLLQVEVLRDGSVGTVTVLSDAGYTRLTKAAIAAARKGRFKPATRDGQPVRATVRIPFRFVLK